MTFKFNQSHIDFIEEKNMRTYFIKRHFNWMFYQDSEVENNSVV